MYKSKVLVGFVLICYVLFAIFEFSGKSDIAFYFNSMIVPVITIIYTFCAKYKSRLFWLFLICFSLSDIVSMVLGAAAFDEFEHVNDFVYYLGNSLFILAYLFLVFKIGKSIALKYLLNSLKIHVLVLIVLNLYLIYVLHEIINPNLVHASDYYLELIYNIVVLTLLSVALLNFVYLGNKKALCLFLGALFIVFSEVIDIAYIYISRRDFLSFLSTTSTLIAFYFFYQQSKLSNVRNDDEELMLAE